MTAAPIRAFAALELPAELQAAIQQVIAPWKTAAGPAVRWVTPANIHLTLQFLGDVSPSTVRLIQEQMALEAALHQPFTLVLQKFGMFPNPTRPRIFWVGILPSPYLLTLQRQLSARLQTLGFIPEERAFSPHLTVGRATPEARPEALSRASAALAALPSAEIGRTTIRSITLFKSDLRPGGSIYTPLVQAAFLPDR